MLVTSVPAAGTVPSGRAPSENANAGLGLRRAAPIAPSTYGRMRLRVGTSTRTPACPVRRRQSPAPDDGEPLIGGQIRRGRIKDRLQLCLQIAEPAERSEHHHMGRNPHAALQADVTGRVTRGRGEAAESGDASRASGTPRSCAKSGAAISIVAVVATIRALMLSSCVPSGAHTAAKGDWSEHVAVDAIASLAVSVTAIAECRSDATPIWPRTRRPAGVPIGVDRSDCDRFFQRGKGSSSCWLTSIDSLSVAFLRVVIQAATAGRLTSGWSWFREERMIGERCASMRGRPGTADLSGARSRGRRHRLTAECRHSARAAIVPRRRRRMRRVGLDIHGRVVRIRLDGRPR